ncbi:AzlC family ABC transporter permease [Rhizobium sp. AG855]|uniref:AzlC family ABC transporter permease n=1 Tax=Rhizobium sp. AG855 TaxID=2183898 RepID=UPI000E7481E2|nr:AzlC family ABC transporter permease [Rhizobium sp. AG855]RKE84338.1 putative branched-subunit amino acid permease [Rhizobium sp. AG855]
MPNAAHATRSDFAEGALKALPVIISAGPFAILFGAVAVANGQTVAEATLMSAVVYAGASQLVGIELFGQHVPLWIVVLSILAVNFRHILYSAALTPLVDHFTLPQKLLSFFLLTDPQFAETLARGETGHKVTFRWYLGFGAVIYFPWVVMSAIGGMLGKIIGDPAIWGIDVLLPIYFMGLVLGFRRRSNFLPIVVVSAAVSVLAQHLVGAPWHISIGAIAGIALAALLPPKTQGAAEEQAS